MLKYNNIKEFEDDIKIYQLVPDSVRIGDDYWEICYFDRAGKTVQWDTHMKHVGDILEMTTDDRYNNMDDAEIKVIK
jgi:hypothetical protein